MHTHSGRITVHSLRGLCWWHVGERFQRLVVHNADLRLKSQTTINVETLLKTSCTEDYLKLSFELRFIEARKSPSCISWLELGCTNPMLFAFLIL